jgi:hypothetical protein
VTAETIEKTFIGIDAERRCFFRVKGTEPDPSIAFFRQSDMIADDRDDIGLIQNFLNKAIGDSGHQRADLFIESLRASICSSSVAEKW